MSILLHSIKSRMAAVCFAVFILAAASSYAADPKIVKASHEQVAKGEVQEAVDPKNEDMTYTPQWPEPPNTGAMLLRLCLGTAIVLGVCVGSLWLGKPWLQRLQVKGTGNASFYIEGSVNAGNRATLYLVRVGNTQLIAGTDASGLKSLIAIPPTFKEVLDEQVPEEVANEAAAQRSERVDERAGKAGPAIDVAQAVPHRPFAAHVPFRSGLKD